MLNLLESRIPPPLVMLLAIIVMWVLSQPESYFSGFDPAVITSLLLVTLGIIVILCGVREFKRAVTTVNPLKPDSATHLVTGGIFSYTRNPMYLGMALILIANVVYLKNPWCLAVLMGFVLFIDRFQITPEERAMRTLFGSTFEEYCQKVRRWI